MDTVVVKVNGVEVSIAFSGSLGGQLLHDAVSKKRVASLVDAPAVVRSPEGPWLVGVSDEEKVSVQGEHGLFYISAGRDTAHTTFDPERLVIVMVSSDGERVLVSEGDDAIVGRFSGQDLKRTFFVLRQGEGCFRAVSLGKGVLSGGIEVDLEGDPPIAHWTSAIYF